MTKQTVLVTGSTGATGGFAIDALLRMGVWVRALVRRDDERSARLREAGAEPGSGICSRSTTSVRPWKA